jgi:hypothetical protein
MGGPTRGRWSVQLRLGVDPKTEVPDVWGSLRTEDRAAVIGRLGEVMAKAVAAGRGHAEEEAGEDIQDGEGSGGVTRIA